MPSPGRHDGERGEGLKAGDVGPKCKVPIADLKPDIILVTNRIAENFVLFDRWFTAIPSLTDLNAYL